MRETQRTLEECGADANTPAQACLFLGVLIESTKVNEKNEGSLARCISRILHELLEKIAR
jgi:hypothetical protein